MTLCATSASPGNDYAKGTPARSARRRRDPLGPEPLAVPAQQLRGVLGAGPTPRPRSARSCEQVPAFRGQGPVRGRPGAGLPRAPRLPGGCEVRRSGP